MVSAAIYARISMDRESDEHGVMQQEQDCRRLAERLGLTVTQVYVDNDIGASTRSKKKSRPQYAQMLEDARSGLIDIIIAYSNSRLTRRPLELEDLITLHERHGTKIITAVSGQDDLSTADGRMVARIKASVDAAEAERTSERLTRRHLQLAQEGVPFGHRAFGWSPDGSPHPVEAPIVARMVEDALAGVPSRQIASWLNTEGVKTAQGGLWAHQTVRQYLRNPRLAGWRTRHRQIVKDASGRPVEGLWEPLVDPETWEAVQGALRGLHGAREGSREGARRYMLSGVLRCGLCGGVMSGNRKSERSYTYRCTDKGHALSIAGVPLDAMVGRLIVARLAEVDLTPVDTPFPQANELIKLEHRIADTMKAYTAGDLDGSLAFPMLRELESKRADMQKDRTRWLGEAKGPVLDRMDYEQWLSLPKTNRRLIVGRLLEAILVKPSVNGRRFDRGRVTPVWRKPQVPQG